MKMNFVQTLSTSFGQDFEVEVQAILKSLVSISPLMFCRGYEVESWFNLKFSRDAGVWLRF